MQADIAGEIRAFIIDTFLFGQGDRLRDDASFLAEGLVDSTGVLELVSLVEQKYGIEVADEELSPDNFDSVARLAAYVHRKLAGAGDNENTRSVGVGAGGI